MKVEKEERSGAKSREASGRTERNDAPANNADKPLVLIVDDHPDTLYMYSRYLDGQGRFRVLTAMTGREALVKARRLQPDVILLDLSMPEMDGYEVARELATDA